MSAQTTATPIDFSHMPGHLVRKLQQVQLALFMRHADGVDMPPVQFAALAYCDAHPGVDQATLARAICYDPVTVGGVVSRLEKKGWLRREIDAADRRAKRVFATAEGQDALGLMRSRVDASQLAFLAPLAECEGVEFTRLVEKLLAAHSELLPGSSAVSG